MIHYIEGFPGLGKTYFSVVILAKRLKEKREKPYEHIVSNVRGYDSDDFDVEDLAKPNTLYIIDEIQKFNKHHDKLFLHLCEHRHLGQDWVIMTQCKDAIPRKFMGLIERSYCLEPVAGGSSTRAVCRIGKPNVTNKMIISNEIFKPRATDVYKTVSDGSQIPKRKMPMKYIMIMAVVPVLFFVTIGIGKAAYSHFSGKGAETADIEKPSSNFSPLNIASNILKNEPTKKNYNSVKPSISKCPDSLGGSFDNQIKFLECSEKEKKLVDSYKILHLFHKGRHIYHDKYTAISLLKTLKPGPNLEHLKINSLQNIRTFSGLTYSSNVLNFTIKN